MFQWINDSILPASILPADPITVKAAHRGIITEFARLLAFRRFDAKIAGAHRVDELPHPSAGFAPYSLPLHIIDGDSAADVGAIAQHLAIQALIQTLAAPSQTIITATR